MTLLDLNKSQLLLEEIINTFNIDIKNKHINISNTISGKIKTKVNIWGTQHLHDSRNKDVKSTYQTKLKDHKCKCKCNKTDVNVCDKCKCDGIPTTCHLDSNATIIDCENIIDDTPKEYERKDTFLQLGGEDKLVPIIKKGIIALIEKYTIVELIKMCNGNNDNAVKINIFLKKIQKYSSIVVDFKSIKPFRSNSSNQSNIQAMLKINVITIMPIRGNQYYKTKAKGAVDIIF